MLQEVTGSQLTVSCVFIVDVGTLQIFVPNVFSRQSQRIFRGLVTCWPRRALCLVVGEGAIE